MQLMSYIVSVTLGERLVQLAVEALKSSSWMLYGPYKYNGQFTTQSNATFDQWLKDRDPASGVRDFEAVIATAQCTGLHSPKITQCLPTTRCLYLSVRDAGCSYFCLLSNG